MHRGLLLLMQTLCLGLMALPMHPPLLIAVSGVRTTTSHLELATPKAAAATTVVQSLALHGHTVGSLSLLEVLAMTLGHGGGYSSLTPTNLQLVHQQSERGDKLNQIGIFGAHDLHLVLLIRLFVDLLLKVKAPRFLWLNKSHKQIATLKEDL